MNNSIKVYISVDVPDRGVIEKAIHLDLRDYAEACRKLDYPDPKDLHAVAWSSLCDTNHKIAETEMARLILAKRLSKPLIEAIVTALGQADTINGYLQEG